MSIYRDSALINLYFNSKFNKDWAREELIKRGYRFKTFMFLSGSREVIVGFEPKETPRA